MNKSKISCSIIAILTIFYCSIGIVNAAVSKAKTSENYGVVIWGMRALITTASGIQHQLTQIKRRLCLSESDFPITVNGGNTTTGWSYGNSFTIHNAGCWDISATYNIPGEENYMHHHKGFDCKRHCK